MSVPNHKLGCQSKTFQTKCRDCGEEVFYFSCNCGSKVFFNSKGGSWPRHSETCLVYLFRLNLEEGYRNNDEILELIEEKSLILGMSIPEKVYKLLKQEKDKLNNRLNIIQTNPSTEVVSLFCSVVSVTPKVNFFKVFKYEKNMIGEALLGNLLRDSYCSLRLREEPDENKKCREFKVFVKNTTIIKQGLRQNTSVVVTLMPHQIPGRDAIWIVDAIERV